jgi:hypothetical protein
VSRVRAGASPGSGTLLRESLLFYDGDLAGGAPPSLAISQRIGARGRVPRPHHALRYDGYGNRQITSPRASRGDLGVTRSSTTPYHGFLAVVNEPATAELYATPPSAPRLAPGSWLVRGERS